MRLLRSFAQLFRSEEHPQAARRKPGPLRVESLEDRSVPAALSAPFTVNNPSFFEPSESANASSANGMSVVVWSSRVVSNNFDIRAQMFDASGKKFGSEIAVEDGQLNDFDPSVAMDADGDFVVSWTQQSGTNANIVARQYSKQGVPRTNQKFPVATNSATSERDSDVAMDANGNFVISWTQQNGNSSDQDVLARKYRNDGVSQGTAFIATSGQFAERESSVAMTPDGRISLVYTRAPIGTTPGTSNVLMARFNAQGQRIRALDGGDFIVAGTSGVERDADISMDSAGRAVVVYENAEGGRAEILAKRIDANGLPTGAPITITPINAGVRGFDPVVAIERNSPSSTPAFVVAYRDAISGPGSLTRVTEVDREGDILRLDAVPSEDDEPAISIDANGNYLLTYTGRNIFNGVQITGHREKF